MRAAWGIGAILRSIRTMGGPAVTTETRPWPIRNHTVQEPAHDLHRRERQMCRAQSKGDCIVTYLTSIPMNTLSRSLPVAFAVGALALLSARAHAADPDQLGRTTISNEIPEALVEMPTQYLPPNLQSIDQRRTRTRFF
jgi:hypothetical protein